MRLLLIRHGETVDNVAGIYAGITNSALTNHGVLQAQRLGTYLAMTDIKVSHLFSSDLQRAVNTAEAIRSAQSPTPAVTTRLEILREQDFGFYEGKTFFERPRNSTKTGKESHLEAHRNDPGFKDVESRQAMATRMDTFVELYLVSLLMKVEEDKAVVVVAHGIILSYLWRSVLKIFHRANVHVAPGVIINDNGRSVEHLGGWSNTGYLDLHVKHHGTSIDTSSLSTGPILQPLSSSPMKGKLAEPFGIELQPLGQEVPALVDAAKLPSAERVLEAIVSPASIAEMQPEASDGASPTQQHAVSIPSRPTSANLPPSRQISNMALVVKAVNSTEHLKGLKKTRGGIGNLKHDSSQKTVDSFFVKKQRKQ